MAREIEALRYMIEAVWTGERAVNNAQSGIKGIGVESELAANKQRQFNKQQKELAKAVEAGTISVDDANAKLRAYRNELGIVDETVETSTNRFKNFGVGLAVATAAIAGAGMAARKAYQMIGEGADLLRAEDQFGRLAESIDSTADSLMGRLRDATRGMVTDAELMQSATQIMSLGLQDTEDGVTRLTSVAGQLGWDMNQVILTMANNSTMRLDALGLSIEDVQTKAKALEEQGFDADKAFDLAVIEAGEEKYKLLGDRADTVAGQMQILETAAANAQDEFKVALVEGFADGLASVASNAKDAGESLIDASSAAGLFLGELAGGTLGALGKELKFSDIVDFGVDQGTISKASAMWMKLGGAKMMQYDPGLAATINGLQAQMEAYERIRKQFETGQAGRNAHFRFVDEDDTDELRAAAEATQNLTNAQARQHAAGMNYVAGLELAGIATANMRAETESAAWNAEHFGGTLLSLPDSLHSTADEAWLAAGGIGGVAAAADAAEQAVRDLEDALRGLSGEAIDFYSFSGGVSEAVGFAQRSARNQDAVDQYYNSGGGYEYGGAGGIAPAPVRPGGGGAAPQITVNNYNRESAAIAMTSLGLARRAGLDQRMGVA